MIFNLSYPVIERAVTTSHGILCTEARMANPNPNPAKRVKDAFIQRLPNLSTRNFPTQPVGKVSIDVIK